VAQTLLSVLVSFGTIEKINASATRFPRNIFQALSNLRRTGANYLITTTFLGDRSNEDIRTGEWRALNLQRPPFQLPAPLALIDERCHHTDGIYADKRLGLWRFADLPAFKT